MKLSVKNTMWFSLLVQIITGIVSLHGLFITLPEKDSILTDILGLETMVQFVEMVFYMVSRGFYFSRKLNLEKNYFWPLFGHFTTNRYFI